MLLITSLNGLGTARSAVTLDAVHNLIIKKEEFMTETKLLDSTLELIDETGTSKAYEYLKSNLSQGEDWSSQVYNFLYCLAATSENPEEALSWLNEAISEKGLWYRPEVFEDEDLDTIRNSEKFQKCVEVSNKRYEEAMKSSVTMFTWTSKSADKLAIVLHGNQQNNTISKSYWDSVCRTDYQIEYLQSSEIDSCDLFRWSDDGDGPDQLNVALNSMEDVSYSNIVLAGFSAGCNTILRGILEVNVQVDKLILFSPWMPIVEEKIADIIQRLKVNVIDVVIVCGTLDEECMPLCKVFEDKAMEMGFDFTLLYIDGMAHKYPEDLGTFIGEHL